MINGDKLLRVSAHGLSTPETINVLVFGADFLCSFALSCQDGVYQSMAFIHNRPYRVFYVAPEAGSAYPVVVSIAKPFGDDRLPQAVNAVLSCKLSVVIGSGVEGHMGITQVVAYFGGELEDAGGILGSEGFHQVPESFFQVPWEDPMGLEGIFGKQGHGFLPAPRQVGRIPVQVYVMPRRFPRKNAPTLVWFRSLASQVFYVWPVKGKKGLRQRKYRQTVDAPMGPKTPCPCLTG